METVKQIYAKIDSLDQLHKAIICTKVAIGCFSLFLLLLIIYAAGSTGESSSQPRLVIVSMDGDAEEFAALSYLLHRADVRIGLIVLSGNGWSSSLAALNANVQKFLSVAAKLSTRATNIEVVYGYTFTSNFSQFQCTYSKIIPRRVGTMTDLLYRTGATLSKIAQLSSIPQPKLFVNSMRDLLSSSAPNSVTILSLSSLTDFSEYFLRYPADLQKVNRFVASGGAFGTANSDVPQTGNVVSIFPENRKAEFNVFFDPEAAKKVLEQFQAPSPVYLATLDAANTIDPGTALWPLLVDDAALRKDEVSTWIAELLTSFRTERPWNDAATTTGKWPFLAPLITAVAACDDKVLSSSIVSESKIDVTVPSDGLPLKQVGETRRLSKDPNANSKPIVKVIVRYDAAVFMASYRTVASVPWPKRRS